MGVYWFRQHEEADANDPRGDCRKQSKSKNCQRFAVPGRRQRLIRWGVRWSPITKFHRIKSLYSGQSCPGGEPALVGSQGPSRRQVDRKGPAFGRNPRWYPVDVAQPAAVMVKRSIACGSCR